MDVIGPIPNNERKFIIENSKVIQEKTYCNYVLEFIKVYVVILL